MLDNETSYGPSENELKVASLKTLLSDFILSNENVSQAYANVSSSRADRNKTLYSNDIGLVDTAMNVKNYIKSAYGVSSPQYNQIKSIKFKNEKIG